MIADAIIDMLEIAERARDTKSQACDLVDAGMHVIERGTRIAATVQERQEETAAGKPPSSFGFALDLWGMSK